MDEKRIGLIDIGSNTIRLVIFEIDQNYNIFELQNIKTPARLSQYLNDDKVMAQEGINLLAKILNNFLQVAEQYNVADLMPMATAAIRQSKNHDDISEQVKEKTGITLQIVPEEKEAFYGSYAVTLTTAATEGITVDIGGGSTELTYFKDKEIEKIRSFPFGVVTLKQMFLKGKKHNDSKAIKKMAAFIKDEFTNVDWLQKTKLPVTAIGGSARNIANVHQRQNDYPLAGVHGYQMSKLDLEATLELFRNQSLEELENLDGLSQDRADIIIPANLVFNTLVEVTKAPSFMFSNRGLREGILIESINNDSNDTGFSKHNIRTQSIYKLGLYYNTQDKVADQRGNLVSMLYDEFCKEGIFEKDNNIERLLQYGSYLYYLGKYVESGASSQHTFYIVSNSELDGINHKERVIIALLASYKNRSLFKQYIEPFENWFNEDFINQLRGFGGIIKFANALNDSHLNVVKNIKLNKKNGHYELLFYHDGDVIAERYRVLRQKKHIDRVLPMDVELYFVDIHSGEKTIVHQDY